MTATPGVLVHGPRHDDDGARTLVDALRERLPPVPPFTLWRRQDLTGADRVRRYALPLLALTRNALWVLHLDGRTGHLSGDDTLWRWTPHGSTTSRTVEAPFDALQVAARALAEALDAGHLQGTLQRRVPVRAAVALTAPVVLEGPLADRPDVFAVAEPKGLARLLEDLTAAPDDPEQVIRQTDRDAITAALHRAGLTDASQRLVKGYRLGELVEDHEIWQEHRAVHAEDPTRTARVRTWIPARAGRSGPGILPRAGSEAERATLARAVRTEAGILRHLGQHRSILALIDADPDGTPPRALFEDFDGLPLDRFLREHRDLSFDDRLAIVLDVGDALAHCHRHDTRHRNLSPASVLARRSRDGHRIEVRLHRFESGARTSPNATRLGTSHPSAFGGRMDELYRAPELFQAAQDADASADLFSLGALAWFLFTGKHPAPTLIERAQRIREDEGLRLWRELDDADDELDDLIAAATRPFPHQRVLDGEPLTVASFVARLRARFADADPEPVPDPLLADVGAVLATSDGEMKVLRVLGEGASSRVLHVVLPGGGTAALKLPIAPKYAATLEAEANALSRLDHEHVVRLLGQPRLPAPDGTVTGLLLQYAGDQTLAERVRAEGTLSLDFCARLGDQLLSALAHLHARGVAHRDLKPQNLAFTGTGKQAHKVLLFDLSLAAIDPADVTAGTTGWRDPFLGQNRWAWDDAADLYGAAACLYFALTGERPVLATRGDGAGRVRVEPSRFDASVRGLLTAFFTRAFAPDVADRHPDAEAMHHAWRALFDDETTSILSDPGGAPAPDGPALRRRARLDTPVAQLGLSARAVDGLERAGVFDVRDLLALPRYRMTAVRGVGAETLRQIEEAARELRQLLGGRPDVAAAPFLGPLPGLPRALQPPPPLQRGRDGVGVQLPLDEAALTKLRDAGLRTTHDLALHSATGVVRLLGLSDDAAKALRQALRDTAPPEPLTGPIPGWVKALLSPNSPSRRTRWEERVRMLVGLDPMPDDPPLGARTTARAAAACGDTPSVYRAAFQTARDHWRKHRATADEVVAAVLAALGGPAAPIERVARALLGAHVPGSVPPDDVHDDALRQAAALVRFATELDVPNPPLVWQLLGGRAWVAPDPRTLPAIEHAARALVDGVGEAPVTAERAAEIAAPHVAKTALAALPVQALLELVVAAEPALALSSRSEVYPSDLSARTAVLLAAPVLQSELTPADVHKRVRGRFPRGEPLPDRPALDDLVAPLRLQWSNDRGRYLRPDSGAASLSRTRATGVTTATTGSPVEVEAGRFRLTLRRSLEAGGFRVLQVGARNAEKARRLLVEQVPGLEVTSLDQAIVDRLMARVHATPGAQLEPILELERTRTPPGAWQQLVELFVWPVLDELVADVLAAREKRPQLLVHPGLLARYDARAALDRLVRTAASEGRGAVWLLLPAYDDGGPPVVHHPDRGLPVPLTSPAQAIRVPRRWLMDARND